MPRVLRILNRLIIGGPTYNAAYLTAGLAPEFTTRLLTAPPEPGERSSREVLDRLGVEAEFVPGMRRSVHPLADLRAYRHIRSVIRGFRPDIVHTHASKAGALGRAAARREGVPVVLHTFHGHTFHSYFSPASARFYLEVERRLARWSTRIVAISELQKRELTERFAVCEPARVAVVPLGIDTGRFADPDGSRRRAFREGWSLAENDVAVGVVGRIAPVKDLELFLRALAATRDRSSSRVRGVVVGDGDDRPALEDRARSLGLSVSATPDPSADVLFTSWIPDAAGVHPGLDLVAMTSRNEGTPVSLIEAQAAGRPVVATDVGGVRDTVVPGTTGFVVDRGDFEGLVEALVRLADDPQARRSMGEAGREHARERFDVARLLADTRRLYRELLETQAPSR